MSKLDVIEDYARLALSKMSVVERKIFNQVSAEYVNDMSAWSEARKSNTRCLTCGAEFGEGVQCRTIKEGKKKHHVCQTCWNKLKGGK